MQVRGKGNNKYFNIFVSLRQAQNTMFPSLNRKLIPVIGDATYAPRNGTIEEARASDRKALLLLLLAIVNLTARKTVIQVTMSKFHTYILDNWAPIALFKKMTLHQGVDTKPVAEVQALLIQNQSVECEHTLSQLIHQTTKTDKTRWCSKPEICNAPSKLNPNDRRIYIYDDIIKLRTKEKVRWQNTTNNQTVFWRISTGKLTDRIGPKTANSTFCCKKLLHLC